MMKTGMFNTKTIYKELLPKLRKLEELRMENRSKSMKAMKTCGVLAGFVLFFAIVMSAVAIKVGVVVGIVGAIGIVYFYHMLTEDGKKKYNHLYKNQVISEIARHISPSLTYSSDDGFCPSVFLDIGHYTRDIDRFQTEDQFTGKLGATTVSFGEVHAECKVEDERGRESWETLFKGVLFKADFHKEFNTWVTVRPDMEVGLVGWIGNKVEKFSSTRIRMEDEAFEKHFKVDTGDDQEARYILTPDMQQRLLNIRKNYGSRVIVSFEKGSVYMTIPMTEDWFESSLKVSALSEDQVVKIAMQIRYFIQLVEDLDLNTRIWTKV